MSLDLRGVLPSAEELDQVEAQPVVLDALVQSWLDDPRVETRLVHLLQERWYTRVDTFDIEWYDYGFSQEDEYSFERAVGEEPLRVIARVIAEDLPWSEVVTGDWTMTPEILAGVWPVSYPEGETGWQRTRYTDGRPAAGVLHTNGLWWRYTTNESNMNRGRAAAISRLLLCEDVLGRPVSLSFAGGAPIVDPAEDARTNPACLSCHSSLDPVAATLFGFWWLNMYSAVEETRYHPERERLYTELGVSPGWYGDPVDGLSGLGSAIAADPRLYRCAVESFAEGVWRRELTVEDFDAVERLRDAFVKDGAHPKALLLALLGSDEYRAGAGGEPVARTTRMLAPDQLTSAVAELTGFTWSEGGVPLLDVDDGGFRLLAGGVDGASAYTPQREPGLTWELVSARLAQGAAGYAADRLGVAGPLGDVPDTAVPGDRAFDDALSAFVWRAWGQRLDADTEAGLAALWAEVAAEEGAAAGWSAILGAVLRDPSFLSE